MVPAAAYHLLAQASNEIGPLPPNTVLIGLLALGLFALAVAAEKGVSIWSKLRKSPPDHETYATKGEVAELEKRMERRIGESLGEIKTRIGHLEATMARFTQDFALAIGRLEGRTETLPAAPAKAAARGGH